MDDEYSNVLGHCHLTSARHMAYNLCIFVSSVNRRRGAERRKCV